MSREMEIVVAGTTPFSRSALDDLLITLADAQHGRVARWQLRQAGVTAAAVRHRVSRGHLRLTVLPGVFSLGNVVGTMQASWMGAVLHAGPGATLARRAAGALYRVRGYSGRSEVAVPGDRRATRVRILRLGLAPDERTCLEGIPVTTSSRTLFDLAGVLDVPALRRCVEEAEVLRLTDTLSLSDLIDRYPGYRGVRRLRTILAAGVSATVTTRSVFEQRFLVVIERALLPRPKMNLIVEGLEVDACWPQHRLIVELDGRAAHDTVRAFERDRERDRRLTLAGWRVVRITWRQLHHDGQAVVTDLRTLIA